MSRPTGVWRLLAYDVRDPGRLRRLHYRLQRDATYLQESVALLKLDDVQLDEFLQRISPLLAEVDDLRIYHLACLGDIWLFGANPISGAPLGVCCTRSSRA